MRNLREKRHLRPRSSAYKAAGKMNVPGITGQIYERNQMRVISTIQDVAYNGHKDKKGPTYLVSVSVIGGIPTDEDCRAVLADFAMPEPWDEDNHHPGLSRAFFCPVDPQYRGACECKEEEETITDPVTGRAWTNPKYAREYKAVCRGCEYEQISGRLCPIHGGAR